MSHVVYLFRQHGTRNFTKKQGEAMKNRLAMLAVVLSFGLIFGGCLAVGGYSAVNMADISDTVSAKTLPKDRDVLSLGIEVAQTMGFRLAGRDVTRKIASLESADAGGWDKPLSLLIGKVENRHLTITAKDGRTLSIQVITTGNLGSGDYKDADQIIAEFKKRFGARTQ